MHLVADCARTISKRSPSSSESLNSYCISCAVDMELILKSRSNSFLKPIINLKTPIHCNRLHKRLALFKKTLMNRLQISLFH